MGENMIQDLILRLESPAEYREVEHVTREAFWNHHVPGCDEHYLAHALRDASCFLPELDFVADQKGRIVGNIMYTRALIYGDDGVNYPVLSFGPISVLPDWQKKGVGGALICHSLAVAKELGHTAVLIYGDPAYYSRFGFVAAEQFRIGTSDGHYAAALQAIELVPGALDGKAGRFQEDKAYEIDEDRSAQFDRDFPVKEKLENLPSQKRFLGLVVMRTPR